ncbi:hypothetical protein BJ878DRAFT_237356 [Calycina marina]|uniref:Uncharacterized protein n=1 Tax=Calycina marina TaxID=1763456 RepID=A0A9P8CJJ0_9HELO|nr:hypothetical protein BJ878DRAFT_237356 [Calycina marina]
MNFFKSATFSINAPAATNRVDERKIKQHHAPITRNTDLELTAATDRLMPSADATENVSNVSNHTEIDGSGTPGSLNKTQQSQSGGVDILPTDASVLRFVSVSNRMPDGAPAPPPKPSALLNHSAARANLTVTMSSWSLAQRYPTPSYKTITSPTRILRVCSQFRIVAITYGSLCQNSGFIYGSNCGSKLPMMRIINPAVMNPSLWRHVLSKRTIVMQHHRLEKQRLG